MVFRVNDDLDPRRARRLPHRRDPAVSTPTRALCLQRYQVGHFIQRLAGLLVARILHAQTSGGFDDKHTPLPCSWRKDNGDNWRRRALCEICQQT